MADPFTDPADVERVQESMRLLTLQLGLLEPDLARYLETVRHVESVGWFLDPTTYRDKMRGRELGAAVAEALSTAVRRIREAEARARRGT